MIFNAPIEQQAPPNSSDFTRDVLADMKSVLNMALSKRMRLMIPLSVWTGISIAFYSGILVCILTDTMPNETSAV